MQLRTPRTPDQLRAGRPEAIWPALKPVLSPNGNFLPEQSLGLVSLGFGDNVRFGGTSAAPPWSVPLTSATVLVDGVAVVLDGRLVP